MMPLCITAIVPEQSTCGCASGRWGRRGSCPPRVPHRDGRAAAGCPSSSSAASSSRASRALHDGELAVEHGDPGRVVAPVLQTTESFEDDREGLVGPHVADDAAHGSSRVAGVRGDRFPNGSGAELLADLAGDRLRVATRVLRLRLDHHPDERLGPGGADESRGPSRRVPPPPRRPHPRRRWSRRASRGSGRWTFSITWGTDHHAGQVRHGPSRPCGEREEPDGGEQSVPRGRDVPEDQVAGLLSADRDPFLEHLLEDVAVAHLGRGHRDARRPSSRDGTRGSPSPS